MSKSPIKVVFMVAPFPDAKYLRSASSVFEVIAALAGVDDNQAFLVLQPLVCCKRIPYSKLAGVWCFGMCVFWFWLMAVN